MRGVLDWLESRTGYRTALRHLLHEPLPKGTGWAFTTGSVLLLLIGVQLLSGVGLSMYYVPTPSMAYDSVRFISYELTLGWLLRGLHFWGASFIVVAAGIHVLRVFLFGSYKAPREVTWITGVVLLLLILAFALSGYLLPWDQRAYWATTVTINIARSAPIAGEYVATVLQGGNVLGAMTLGRWYTAHVFLLPAALALFVVAHLALVRRHGISGPIRRQEGPSTPFYPWHAIKDTLTMAAVFVLLLATAITLPAHLDQIANPADTGYVPRPEWYFLALFELLKYFPGPQEPIATIVIPALVAGFLMLLPFVDRGNDRHPLRGKRRRLTVAMTAIAAAAGVLTVLGLRDMPPRYEPNDWGPHSVTGHLIVAADNGRCTRCHVAGGPAADLVITRITKDEEWLMAHMADPVALAPGVRSAEDPAPTPMLGRFQAQAVVAYLRRIRAGGDPPRLAPPEQLAITTFASTCVTCHRIAGEGGQTGPDLSHVGARRDEVSIKQVILDPASEFPGTPMPKFGTRLEPEQIDALAQYLSRRRD